MVSAAEGEIRRIGLAHCTVGELGSGMREDAVPPVEESGRIAFRGDGVVSGAVTG